MINGVPNDDELFESLQAKIRGRVPGFKIRYKTDSLGQKIIGKLVFFNKDYMTQFTTTSKYTVYFPSREFVEENRFRAFKILAHEYLHLLDRKKHPVVFELFYAMPQVFMIFATLAILAFFFGPWWLVALTSLLAVLPWPAFGRANLEMRGYAMNMAVAIWRHGSVQDSTKEWIAGCFTGWGYYKMWPFPKAVDKWIVENEQLIYKVDALRIEESILDHSEAYQDVYELLTGIEHN